MKTLILRHKQAIIKRGKIDSETTITDYMEKAHEEDVEALMELPNFKNKEPNNFIQETIDSIMPRIHMIESLGFDFEKELLKNVEYQENRED